MVIQCISTARKVFLQSAAVSHSMAVHFRPLKVGDDGDNDDWLVGGWITDETCTESNPSGYCPPCSIFQTTCWLVGRGVDLEAQLLFLICFFCYTVLYTSKRPYYNKCRRILFMNVLYPCCLPQSDDLLSNKIRVFPLDPAICTSLSAVLGIWWRLCAN